MTVVMRLRQKLKDIRRNRKRNSHAKASMAERYWDALTGQRPRSYARPNRDLDRRGQVVAHNTERADSPDCANV